jgi:acetyl-CoA C-acetyltransferase
VEAGIERAAADEYAAESQRCCEEARKAGRFAPEVVAVKVPGRSGGKPGGDTVVDVDEHPRDGVTTASLAKLAPVFRDGGTVTAGNASGITDGAAALVVASEAAAERLGLRAAGYLLDWEVVGVDPRIMGIGPVPAVRQLLGRQRLDYEAIDQVELNEAFASQVLACLKELPFERRLVNPDGGAIALGHPIGATGARILVTLLHGLAARDGRRGVATLCVSGGMGLAALVERAA